MSLTPLHSFLPKYSACNMNCMQMKGVKCDHLWFLLFKYSMLAIYILISLDKLILLLLPQ